MDAVGPEVFSFADLLRKIAETIGRPAHLVPMNPTLALGLSQIVSLFTRDVILTRHEVEGLMADLLVSSQPPTCPTKLSDWLSDNRSTVGVEYASELKKHYL
jgi:NADH dehydrogenase